MTARLLIGDVHDRLAELPDRSVDLFLTSPPFLALRSYLPADHPDKGKEIGSEPTPAAFLDTLIGLTEEFRRVLTPHGSIAVELGDTYAGSGGAGGDYNSDGLRAGQPKFRQRLSPPLGNGDSGPRFTVDGSGGPGWPLDKSLAGIPTLYTWSLAYGRNLLNPAHEIDRWRIRNLLTWCRPNPPVGALGDKFRPATSFVTVATIGRDRWFDLDAVRTAGAPDPRRGPPDRRSAAVEAIEGWKAGPAHHGSNPAGAPPLDWDAPDNWDALFQDALDDFLAAWWQPLVGLPTQPYKGAHYATFPLELAKRLIEAMCPRQVCTVCGVPRRRIVGEAEYVTARNGQPMDRLTWEAGERNRKLITGSDNGGLRHAPTLGWTDCGHNNWRPGIVLDPFAGSGTTLAAAIGCGRDAIGIDLDDRNATLAVERCGMFLEVA